MFIAVALAGCAGSARINLADVERCNIEFVELTVRQFMDDKFAEKHRVQMGEYFFIWDTPYKARVTHYVPHFERGLKTGRVKSRSNEATNPAIKVELFLGEKKVYYLWFLAKVPFYHRSKKPGFAFIVDKVEYGPGGAPDFTAIVFQPTLEEIERLEKGFHGRKKVKDLSHLKEEGKQGDGQQQEKAGEEGHQGNENKK